MQVGAALADPVRAEIVELLATGDRTAGEIADRFPISRPAVSRHLRILRETGLASVREDAQRRIYSLNPTPLKELELWVARNRRAIEERLDALGRHLDEMERREGAAKSTPRKDRTRR